MKNPFGGANPAAPNEAKGRAPDHRPKPRLSLAAGTLGLALWVAIAFFGYDRWLWRETASRQADALARMQADQERLFGRAQAIQVEMDTTLDGFKRAQQTNRELTTTVRTLEQERREISEAHDRLENEMRAALQSRDVTISELAGKLTVNILDRVLFDSGQAEITEEGRQVLQEVAAVLDQFPDRTIQVLGHTDDVPIHTPQFPSNWELSAARALAAVRFLTEEAGVNPHRLSAVAQGEFHPVADNSNPEGRAKNRRIAIVVLPELIAAGTTEATVLPGPTEP